MSFPRPDNIVTTVADTDYVAIQKTASQEDREDGSVDQTWWITAANLKTYMNAT